MTAEPDGRGAPGADRCGDVCADLFCTDLFCSQHSPLRDVRVRIWFCPDRAHAHPAQPLRPTVRWVGDVAHCLEPGCGRTSADPR